MPISSGNLSFAASVAGIWQAVDPVYVTPTNQGQLANSFFGNARLGSQQWQGVVMIGWQYNGFSSTATEVTPVNLGILEQQADGTLLLDTASYVSSAATNGGGSVVVADFNGDGRDDVFLAAHNESPFLSRPSTVLLSNAEGTFTKLVLDDAVMAHDAEPVILNGELAVITAAFQDDKPENSNPIYTWTGTGFSQSEGELRNDSSGMSVAVGDLDGDGEEELVMGSFFFGPGYDWSPSNKFKVAVYAFPDGDIEGNPLAVITPYFEARPAYAGIESAWGPANTHSYRVWLDDFNHDGRLDILAGQSLWNPANSSWPSMLQMLQNDGDFEFTDVSDTLNPDFDKQSNELDYELQMVDLDGSGIDSYLSGSRTYDSAARQSNFLLVNDGTGRLHVALHEEFVAMGNEVLAYAAAQSGLNVFANGITPRFHGYVTHDGLLNYVAEIVQGPRSVLINVPVRLDIGTDFTTDIEIADRNGSMLMRTFAGNDTVHQAGAASQAHIDGGLGTDTAVYAGVREAFTLHLAAHEVVVGRAGLEDTLANFERLQFNDMTVNLSVGRAAGAISPAQLDSLIELYIAYLNRVPDADGMAYWIGQLAAGQTLAQIGEAFYGSAVHFSQHTGYSNTMTDADFVTLVYRNVLGRSSPDAEGLAYWSNALGSGAETRGSLVAAMLGSAHTFKGHATFGWVADLLDNKIAVGKEFAVDSGLVFNTSEDSIVQGMAIAAAVTSSSIAEALELIGVADQINLLA